MKINIIREIYWTIRTKECARDMTYLEYFCWRILRQYGYNGILLTKTKITTK